MILRPRDRVLITPGHYILFRFPQKVMCSFPDDNDSQYDPNSESGSELSINKEIKPLIVTIGVLQTQRNYQELGGPPRLGWACELLLRGGPVCFPSCCTRSTRHDPRRERIRDFRPGTCTGLEGATSLHEYQRAPMASLTSQDVLTYNLQPHPTFPSPTIPCLLLLLPLTHPPSPTPNNMLSILPNVSHIAHCIISQHITTHPTLSIRPGVVSRVSFACPHPPLHGETCVAPLCV